MIIIIFKNREIKSGYSPAFTTGFSMPYFKTIFWISLFFLFFCYLGYVALLCLLNLVKKIVTKQHNKFFTGEWPPVTLIVASYNEAAVLASKIRNTLEIKYPTGSLEIIFVVDGSTDTSAAIIKNYPSIKLVSLLQRKGKFAAIKSVMKEVKTSVVVFSDANAMLNEDCLMKIMPHFFNPETGGVAGEKKILTAGKYSAVGEAEGLYWKYESFIKKQDAAFNTVVGAAGELFALRTALFKDFDTKFILDDFIISVSVCLQGYKIAYEPGAFATEKPSKSISEEKKRKVRIAAGAYQSIGYLKEALNFFKHPVLAFQYIFHRFFRWTVCPLMLIVLFFTNLLVVPGTPGIPFFSGYLFFKFFFT